MMSGEYCCAQDQHSEKGCHIFVPIDMTAFGSRSACLLGEPHIVDIFSLHKDQDSPSTPI